jgi:hypothetical protein
MIRIPTTIALLAVLAIPVAHAETQSPVLQSLPAEVQKNIEQVRTACRETLAGYDDDTTKITSGDNGLVQFTLSGALAVMVDNLKLCGGNCYKGSNCHTGGHDMAIYVRSGSTWKTAYEGGVRSYSDDILVWLDSTRSPPAFRAMVLGIYGTSEDCPKRVRRTFWKETCWVIVRWNGTRFTYEALFRD